MNNQNVNQTDNDDVEQVGSLSLISKGYNFKFNVEGHEVHGWGSAKSGKEKVYLDGNLISSKWGLTKKSVHQFEVNNVSYEMEFNVVSLLTGELHCILIKNGVHLETQKQIPKPYANKKLANWRLALHTIAAGILGYWFMTLLLNHFSN